VRLIKSRYAALAAAAITPAFAQSVPTVIYGTFNVDVERVEATRATTAGALPAGSMGVSPSGINVPSRNRVTQNSSNLGFRGGEEITRDFSIFWQIESGVNVDSGNSNIASRNTAIGFNGAYGSLRVGQWDTPFKTLSGAVDPMYFTGITYTGAIIGTPGFGVGPTTIAGIATSGDGKTYAGAANASFERRQGNIIEYWLPTVGGVTTRFAYSVNEGRTARSDSVTQINPQIYSASIEYDAGMFFVGYAYESHEDYFGMDALVPATQATPVAATGGSPSASARDRGHKLVGRVKLGATTLGILADKLRYSKTQSNAVPGWFNSYERSAVAFTLLHKMGPHTIRGFYAKAQDGTCSRFDGSACVTQGLGARQGSAGYSYTFSPRTDIYAFYTRVANQSRGSYQFANGAGLAAAAGAASTGVVLGMRHTF
jgi:predicted porin